MLKRILPILLLLAACVPYDDSEIKTELAQHEARLTQLETLCFELNSNISSLRSLVEAVDARDYVTGVSPLYENGQQVGYTISFAIGKPIQIFHGERGTDGYTPVIGVKKGTDGKYYWTLDGNWLQDASGNKLPVSGKDGVNGTNGTNGSNGTNGTNGTDGVTPKLKIQDGYWYVSYDEGKTWSKSGKATGDNGSDGDSFFKSVTETDTAVILTLTDGTVITLEKQKKLDISFDTSAGLGILPGEKRSIAYIVTGGNESTLVKAFGQNGWTAKVVPLSPSKGTIEVQAPEVLSDEEIIVLVSDGESTTIMRVISFEEGVIRSDIASLILKGAGDTVVVDIESNLAVSAKSSASWLTCTLKPATRALTPYTLEVTAGKNLGENERAAMVTVSDPSGKVVHTVAVVQNYYDAFENYVDLSGGGETANCYIINKAGEYMFPIVKGNGSKGLILSGDTADIPDAASAAVVWQDADIVASAGIHKGKVVFETTSSWKKGNAVLAVKNAQGTILWSWHIWSTDYVLGSGDVPVYNHGKTNQYKMMARTLGENGNSALFYQFGRKDPFRKNASETIGSRGSLDAAIQKPDLFFGSSGSDWCTSSRTDWWDAGCKNYNSSTSTASLLRGNKTIYDPCPAGYRVPPDDAFTNFTTTGSNTETESVINSPSPGWYDFLISGNIYYFYTGNGSSTIPFKAFGGLNASTGAYLTNIAYYYGAHPANSACGRLLQFYGGGVKPQNTDYSRALAGTIRPIRDNVESEEVYESGDYSSDGTTVQIQQHTVGSGIKILIVGDGFTDKDISSGKYDRSMRQAADYFFNIEPYKTFQNRFDVVNMRVVSETSVFDSQKRTAFQAVYEGGSHITGNLTAAYNKAYSAFGTIQDVLIIVVMNSDRYAGTCYMAGNMVSVAFCPMSTATYYPFETVIHHEAGGHGFANLGDEYYYSGTIPESEKSEITSTYSSYGWYPNLDVTSDRNSIRWAQFLSNPLYSSSTGVYEGGYSYMYGVYRPTSDSCMNNMYGTFNAPSRFAIYKRIMQRSGDSWTWDQFVAYDAVNRNAPVSVEAHVPIPYDAPHPYPPVAVNLEDYL